MAQASTDNETETVIRTWVETERSYHGSIDYCYSYVLKGRTMQGAFNSKDSLGVLVKNLREMGYAPRLEKGHYKQVWVPDNE